MINSSAGIKIANWVFNNIALIKKHPDSKKKGKKGFSFTLCNLQTSNAKEHFHNFPSVELKYIEEELLHLYKIPRANYSATGVSITYAAKGYEPHWTQDISEKEDEYTTHLKVLINKPVKGGDPIRRTNDEEVITPVSRYEPWLCIGEKDSYSTVKIGGESPYILLSFSYHLNKRVLKKLAYI
tara:strand:+ start:1420 stop:1968 length:549 start_codon:yes stop_codon:yes gene_type:complete